VYLSASSSGREAFTFDFFAVDVFVVVVFVLLSFVESEPEVKLKQMIPTMSAAITATMMMITFELLFFFGAGVSKPPFGLV
jgi:hypothetical protein